ncbi:hypothetical protein HK100_004929 [Physocladia obscura]|uniref:Ankyrin n=1 Tax=Physocladia obscura TaxID=109957 RepID=A0AAD5T8Q2_9FUNG|nr:hypothetical protein HK100_004929 [Physocladia obscura]
MPEKKASPIERCPQELIRHIVRFLPVSASINDIGYASMSIFGHLIFRDIAFAREHFRFQFRLCATNSTETIWEFMDRIGVKDSNWKALPFNYQTGIYAELCCANRQPNLPLLTSEPENGVMWHGRWPSSAAKSFKQIWLLLNTSGFNPGAGQNRALIWASYRGHLRVVKLLLTLESVNPRDCENCAIFSAAREGHADVVALLLKYVDPRVGWQGKYTPLFAAIYNNRPEVVKLLLGDGRVDPRWNEDFAIGKACELGHLEIVRILLQDKRVVAGFNEVRIACVNAQFHVVKLLLIDARRVKLESEEAFELHNLCGSISHIPKLLWKSVAMNGGTVCSDL